MNMRSPFSRVAMRGDARACRIIPGMLVVALCLSGCAGFVGGDLRNTRSDCKMPACTGTPAFYQVLYQSDAKDDYDDDNIADLVSSCTLGIIPTYWTTTVHSEATIFHDGKVVDARKYQSRIHKFYGILWVLILPTKSINALQADEGGGIRVKWGIRDRTLYKVVADHGGAEDQYCLLNGGIPDAWTNTAPKPAVTAP
jgi:hypothetical protein